MVVAENLEPTVGWPLPETVGHRGFVLGPGARGVQPGGSQERPRGGALACQ